MEGMCPADCDRASEMSFSLEDESPEAALEPGEAQELSDSLKEITQTEDVKPKLQCIMSNPSFSMVTVQCEDSGIMWETSSSRCSTPWASEASTTSDVFSMESSSVGSPPGKVIFIMDENKIRRKKVFKSSERALLAPHLKGGLGHKKHEPPESKTPESADAQGEPNPLSISGRKLIAAEPLSESLDTQGANHNVDATEVAEAHVPVVARSVSTEGTLEKGRAHPRGSVKSKIQKFNTVSERTRIPPKSVLRAAANPPFMTSAAKEELPGDTEQPLDKHPKSPFVTQSEQFAMQKDHTNNHVLQPVLNNVQSRKFSNGVHSVHPDKDEKENTVPYSYKAITIQSEKSNSVLSDLTDQTYKQEIQPVLHGVTPLVSEQAQSISSFLTDEVKKLKGQHYLSDVHANPILPACTANVSMSQSGSISTYPLAAVERYEIRLSLPEKSNLAFEKTSSISSCPVEETEERGFEAHSPVIRDTNGNHIYLFAPQIPAPNPVSENMEIRSRGETAEPGEILHSPTASSYLLNALRDTSSQGEHIILEGQKKKHDSGPHLDLEETTKASQDPGAESNVFSIVSEGYEISNILAPPHISSVDQEESEHMQDKLEYLEENPLFKTKQFPDRNNGDVGTVSKAHARVLPDSIKVEDVEEKADLEGNTESVETTIQAALNKESNFTDVNPTKNASDMDYFEKYTLVDDKVPIQPEIQISLIREQFENVLNGNLKNPAEDSTSFNESSNVNTLEDEFYLPETDIDEAFYGTAQEEHQVHSHQRGSLNILSVHNSIDSHSKTEINVGINDESDSTGTQLFNIEERVLSRSMLFPITVKTVNPELLEEPPALAFLYKDLYEQATGDRMKEDSDHSDAESVSSERSFPSCNSDTDDGTGIYFEKYILKDEITFGMGESKKGLKDWYENEDLHQFKEPHVESMGLPKTVFKDAEDVSSQEDNQMLNIDGEESITIHNVSQVLEEKIDLFIVNETHPNDPREVVSCEMAPCAPCKEEVSVSLFIKSTGETLDNTVISEKELPVETTIQDDSHLPNQEVAEFQRAGPAEYETYVQSTLKDLLCVTDEIQLETNEESEGTTAQRKDEIVCAINLGKPHADENIYDQSTEDTQKVDIKQVLKPSVDENIYDQPTEDAQKVEIKYISKPSVDENIYDQPTEDAQKVEIKHVSKPSVDENIYDQSTEETGEVGVKHISKPSVDENIYYQPTEDAQKVEIKHISKPSVDENIYDQPTEDAQKVEIKHVSKPSVDENIYDQSTEETGEVGVKQMSKPSVDENISDQSTEETREVGVKQVSKPSVDENIYDQSTEDAQKVDIKHVSKPSVDENRYDQSTEDAWEVDVKQVSKLGETQAYESNEKLNNLPPLVKQEPLDESISEGLSYQPKENVDNIVTGHESLVNEGEKIAQGDSESLIDSQCVPISESVIVSSHTQEGVFEGDGTDPTIGDKAQTTEITSVLQTQNNIVETEAELSNPEMQSHKGCDELVSQHLQPVLGTLQSQPEMQNQFHDEETAESMDYEVITHEELLLDEMSSDYAQDELMFEDREFSDHASEGGYEFVDGLEQDLHVEHEDSGFEMLEHEELPTELEQKRSESENELSQKEPKPPQIDTYCYACRCPISAIDKIFGEHENHEVTTLTNAVIEMTNHLEEVLDKLQESSIKTEEFVTEIESLYNAVEENYNNNEKLLEEQNEEMIKMVEAQHTEKMQRFEEVKKMKMEYLYDQMVSFQQNIDTAKEILEKTVKETEQLEPLLFLSSFKDINNRILLAMENTLSLDKMPSAFSLFEHYAENSLRSDQKILKHVPVPHIPKLQSQEPNSATSTSITAYWRVSEEDVIDCFQVYCMEEPQGNREQSGLIEEYRVTVKESYCILEELEPDKCYNVWVMAVNYTGCSLPSDKSTFRTAPSTPLIKAEDCTVCWDTAIIRWSTAYPDATESFTLEWCRQYSPEGEGLRSVAGIKGHELTINLQPNENYFFYVKAINNFGSSEQSEAALISTKGTRFHLLTDAAHPALQVSPDRTVMSISEQSSISGIPSVLGELLPARGLHYWEIMVANCEAFRLGVCYKSTPPKSVLAQNNTYWCMHCYSTETSFSYKFLHNDAVSDIHLTEHPVRVGVLLDYNAGRLLFFNVRKGQLLFTIRHRFTEAAHPTFALEAPGELHLHTGIELPGFAKHS